MTDYDDVNMLKLFLAELNSTDRQLLLQKLKHENVYSKDFLPRAVTKPDGRVIKLATFGEIKTALSSNAKVLDVRD